MDNKTFAVCTLGCKVNSYESECLSALFEKEGLKKVGFDRPADIYLINTCSVTNTGDKKSRQAIHRARRTNPDAFIAVLGCYAQAKSAEAATCGADLVAGTKNREEIVRRALLRQGGCIVTDVSKNKEFESLSASPSTDRCRAYIKIQDGCDNFCSYCIIPYTRGRVRSRNMAEVISQVKKLKEEGFREIVLAGIEVYSYGRDLGDTNLITLLREISSKAAPSRIRLSSIDPRAFFGQAAQELAGIKGLCHHFHISAQSGCDETLKRMNRPYTAKEYLNILENIRSAMPDAAISTDIITGFPGETEEEFEKTREFVKKAGFLKVHVFPYSERNGTKAAEMEQLPKKVRTERAKILIKDSDALSFEFARSMEGKTLSVLAESEKDGVFSGYGENYVRVHFTGDGVLIGGIYNVKIKKAAPDGSVSGVKTD